MALSSFLTLMKAHMRSGPSLRRFPQRFAFGKQTCSSSAGVTAGRWLFPLVLSVEDDRRWPFSLVLSVQDDRRWAFPLVLSVEDDR